MEVYVENNYGADADGRRGIKMTFVDLESSDEPAIIEALQKMVDDGDYESIADMPEEVEIYLYCDELGEEIAFMVNPAEYVS